MIQIVKLEDIIEKDDLNFKSKRGKTRNLGKYSLPTVYGKGYTWRIFIIKNADYKQSNFVTELKNFEEGTKALEKNFF